MSPAPPLDLVSPGQCSPQPGMPRDILVGAAYHSPHMASAVGPLGAALDAARCVDARIPVVANVDARLHTAASGGLRCCATR
ncbi:MAG TPA: hypothetical protein VMM13_01295 [Euzebya sp.]|nr:hypothetical protein [Euzebya sp.]